MRGRVGTDESVLGSCGLFLYAMVMLITSLGLGRNFPPGQIIPGILEGAYFSSFFCLPLYIDQGSLGELRAGGEL